MNLLLLLFFGLLGLSEHYWELKIAAILLLYFIHIFEG